MGSEILTYARLGMHHIADLRGYDHILFVAALTVAYRPADWRRLLVLVTAFTVGHSVTLALATLQLVRVDAGLVEAAIAATIVCTSLLSIAGTARSPAEPSTGGAARGQALRYGLALGFGLIHGLGFSTFLRSLLGDEASLFLPLLSFNVGLEVGQLGIVLLVLLVGVGVERLAGLARRDWVLVASGGIAAVGAKILVERLVG
ncbi:MAG: HupE/UreJ family protein [Gemmatimonadales bacterium]